MNAILRKKYVRKTKKKVSVINKNKNKYQKQKIKRKKLTNVTFMPPYLVEVSRNAVQNTLTLPCQILKYLPFCFLHFEHCLEYNSQTTRDTNKKHCG
jgi:hypothetical protein